MIPSMSGGGGEFVQRYIAEYTANASIATVIPYDNTVPQVTEGTQIISTVIAQKSPLNILRLTICGFGCATGTTAARSYGGAVTLFTDLSASAIGATGFQNYCQTGSTLGHAQSFTLVREISLGDIANHTISVRVGPSGGNATSIRLNWNTAGSALWGAAAYTTLTIDEYKP